MQVLTDLVSALVFSDDENLIRRWLKPWGPSERLKFTHSSQGNNQNGNYADGVLQIYRTCAWATYAIRIYFLASTLVCIFSGFSLIALLNHVDCEDKMSSNSMRCQLAFLNKECIVFPSSTMLLKSFPFYGQSTKVISQNSSKLSSFYGEATKSASAFPVLQFLIQWNLISREKLLGCLWWSTLFYWCLRECR